jgi:hypothetical protein
MRTRVARSMVFFLTTLLAAIPASAQYGANRGSERATGETYHVEVGGYFWNPTPEIFITSESLGIIGSRIDFIDDLGIEKKKLTQMRVVARPGTKHKFRFEYTPIKYDGQDVLRRDLVFNGIRFPITVPVSTELIWRAYRFGYEWDFAYMPRGFVGMLLEAKYTDVQATLTASGIGSEFVHARAPIPAIGVIGRGYVMPNISITGEFSFFKLPDVEEDYKGNYYDFDLYGTVNFTDNFGAQVGYRSFSVFYKIEEDEGDLKLKGLYFGGVVRF